MKTITVQGQTQSLQIEVADTFYKRLKGLMGKKQVPNQGLLLKPCTSIHMFFMQIPLDIIYLDKENKVLYIQTLKPWQIGAYVKNTKSILEIKANTNPFQIGEQLKLI